MPCRGRSYSAQDYSDTIDQLTEIISKFSASHNIILAGDMNGSIHREPPNIHDVALRNFLENFDLLPSQDYPTSPTFHHHDGISEAVIDYILLDKRLGCQAGTIRNLQEHPKNTSDHSPVTASLRISIPDKCQPLTSRYGRQRIKPQWKRCNSQLYRETVARYLQKSHCSKPNNTSDSMKQLCTALEKATNAAIPKQRGRKKAPSKGPWTSEIAEASRLAKCAFRTWKLAGRPLDSDDPSRLMMKTQKRNLRRLQRSWHAQSRSDLYKRIMDAAENDQQLFYQLVRKQRRIRSEVTPYIIVEGQKYHSHINILEGWKKHFKKLATPRDKPHFDNHFYKQVNEEISFVKDSMMEDSKTEAPGVTERQVARALMSLKNNKAPDSFGLMAEHLKLGGHPVVSFLTTLFNEIIESGHIPDSMKTGIIIPVLKKNKDHTLPGNYRGITITSTIAKVLESSLFDTINSTFKQCPLQRGFTKGVSPTYAALLVEEAINEARDLGTPLAVATLDAEKAFDLVWHDGLLRKLYHLGMPAKILQVIAELQTAATSSVQWNQGYSEEFQVLQGIRQGAKLSPTLYKIYVDNAISTLLHNRIGASIGSIHVGSPTVTDDIALVADSPVDLQTALHFMHGNSSKDRSTFNSTKSEVVIFNSVRSREPQSWSLGQHEIEESTSAIHLGIHRDNKRNFNILDRIQTGRRALYSLMGAGLHGKHGISPVVSGKMYQTFVRPKVIHGLEAVQLNNKEKKLLENFECNIFKQLQTLPDRTSTTAVYVLMGIPPITSIIEKNAINLLINIFRSPETTEYQMIHRQLAMKNHESSSWVTHIRNLLAKYNLPSAFDLIQNPPTKNA